MQMARGVAVVREARLPDAALGLPGTGLARVHGAYQACGVPSAAAEGTRQDAEEVRVCARTAMTTLARARAATGASRVPGAAAVCLAYGSKVDSFS
jgi:hypothetical protein